MHGGGAYHFDGYVYNRTLVLEKGWSCGLEGVNGDSIDWTW